MKKGPASRATATISAVLIGMTLAMTRILALAVGDFTALGADYALTVMANDVLRNQF